jgi:hypothetical protein
MSKKLLCSLHDFDYEKRALKESAGEDDIHSPIVLRGIIQKAETLNQNGRIYPRHILEREVRNYQKFILESRALGELDHPDSSIISLKNVSHIFTEVTMENDTVYGTLRLLNTPSGKVLQELVRDKVRLGISSRGVGSTERRGDYTVVQDDFQIICWDMVGEPSTSNAFVYPTSKAYTSEGRSLKDSERQHVAETFDIAATKTSTLIDEILCTRK